MSRQSRHQWLSARLVTAKRFWGGSRPKSLSRPLQFEPLEDRRLLTVTVNTLVDENDGVAIGGISLRDAIAAAAPNESINFAPSLFSAGAASLSLTHGELFINKPLSITGPGASLLTIDASANDPTPTLNNGDGDRVFRIDDGNNANLAVVFIGQVTLTGGDTLGDGGGVYSRENFGIADCVITGNAADDGGGLYNRGGYMTLTRATVRGNSSIDDGGGIANGSGRVTFQDGTLSGNHAGDAGGAISNFSDMGGFHNLTIRNSTVSGNTSQGFGGGVFNFSGIMTIEFSTVSNNSAPAAKGSGVTSWGDTNTTRTDVRSSIIAGNNSDDVDHLTGAPFPANSFNSLGYNFIGLGTSLAKFNQTGDQAGIVNPRLGPLGNYGGSTQTQPLLFQSLAVDAGNPTAFAGVNGVPNSDQRGLTRIHDGNGDTIARLDIGSFENHANYYLVDELTDESDGNFSLGDLSLREAKELANANTTSDWILFDPSLSGATILLTLGELAIFSDVVIDATSLTGGFTIDASPNDITPGQQDGMGSRVFDVNNLDDFNTNNVTLRGLTLTGADVSNGGGAIFNLENLTVADCVITGNSARWGGGIYNTPYGTLTVEHSMITGNAAISLSTEEVGSGGGIYNWTGSVTVRDSTISGNTAPDGAGIHNTSEGNLAIIRCDIEGNVAADSGGGLRNDNSVVNISRSRITGNSAGSDGGGIRTLSGGTLTITESTISGNSAGGVGGGIDNLVTLLSIMTSTIDQNYAGGAGGGLYLVTGAANATHAITNSTISGNRSGVRFGGIGVSPNEGDTLIIAHSTITGNVANANPFIPPDTGEGGGIGVQFLSAGTVELSHTIVAGNTREGSLRDDDVSGAIEAHYSLIGDNNGSTLIETPGVPDANGNQIGGPINGAIDARLGPLVDNGGPTMTHALQPDSSAIDAGDPTAVAGNDAPQFDQRGAPFGRIRDGNADELNVIDIGAFEVQEFVPGPALIGDYNLNGVVDAADYTRWRDTLGASVVAYSGADGNGTGSIDAHDYNVWKSHFGNTLPGSGSNSLLPSAPLSLTGRSSEMFSSSGENSPVASVNISFVLPFVDLSLRRPFVAKHPSIQAARSGEGLLAWLSSLKSSRPGSFDDRMSLGQDAHNDRDANDSLAEAADCVFADLEDQRNYTDVRPS